MIEKTFRGFEAFASFLERGAALHEASLVAGAGLAVRTIKEKADGIFGDSNKLTDLAPSTQAERTRLGFTPNDPLVRTGKLRDSFEIVHAGHEAAYGTEDPIMLYQELGTATIPPRPVVEIAIKEAAPEIEEIVTNTVSIAFGAGVRILP